MIDGHHEMNLALSAHVRNWSCKFCDLICVQLYIHFVTVLSAIPPSFSLSVVTEESDSYGPKVGPLSVTLKFTYTANYPDEIPLFEVIDSDGLPDDTDNDEIIELSRTQVRSMDCFTIIIIIIHAFIKRRNPTCRSKALNNDVAEVKCKAN